MPPPRPETPLALIGDVHGCHDLMERMLDRLQAEAPEARVILVGDYIDRGEQSAEVLRHLQARPDLTCLKGNHEDMLLRFLWSPERHGARWLQYGGLQTLASFRVPGVRLGMDAAALTACRDALVEQMGEDMLTWLRALPTSFLSGNIFVTHAGARPDVAPEYQDPEHLVWGHPAFETTPRSDGIWVAHGHVIQDQAHANFGRIALDTGAYATGRLSAALIYPDADIRFLDAIRTLIL